MPLPIQVKQHTNMIPLKYPMVECANHKAEPGYVVCSHVFYDEKLPAQVILATSEQLGQILCEKDHTADDADDARLVCAGCARSRGWLQNN